MLKRKFSVKGAFLVGLFLMGCSEGGAPPPQSTESTETLILQAIDVTGELPSLTVLDEIGIEDAAFQTSDGTGQLSGMMATPPCWGRVFDNANRVRTVDVLSDDGVRVRAMVTLEIDGTFIVDEDCSGRKADPSTYATKPFSLKGVWEGIFLREFMALNLHALSPFTFDVVSPVGQTVAIQSIETVSGGAANTVSPMTLSNTLFEGPPGTTFDVNVTVENGGRPAHAFLRSSHLMGNNKDPMMEVSPGVFTGHLTIPDDLGEGKHHYTVDVIDDASFDEGITDNYNATSSSVSFKVTFPTMPPS